MFTASRTQASMVAEFLRRPNVNFPTLSPPFHVFVTNHRRHLWSTEWPATRWVACKDTHNSRSMTHEHLTCRKQNLNDTLGYHRHLRWCRKTASYSRWYSSSIACLLYLLLLTYWLLARRGTLFLAFQRPCLSPLDVLRKHSVSQAQAASDRCG
jgi:hypothetical protein